MFWPFSRPPSVRCCCLEEACVYRTMSGSRYPPESCEDQVHGPLYRWRHYRKPSQRSDPYTAQQPLDRYKWRTSASLALKAAKMAECEGREPNTERPYLQLLSLPRFSTVPHDGDKCHEGPVRTGAGSLHKIFPYLRSVSEPGTGERPGKAVFRKVGSDAERAAPSVSSFFSSFSRRIIRVLRDEPGPAGQCGRRPVFRFCSDGGLKRTTQAVGKQLPVGSTESLWCSSALHQL